MRGVDDPAHDQRVDDEADDEEQRDRHEHDEVGIDREGDERPEGEVHPEHQELAVGEVDDAHDAEDQGEPDRDQGVDPPEQDRRDDELGEDAYLRWSQARKWDPLGPKRRELLRPHRDQLTVLPLQHVVLDAVVGVLALLGELHAPAVDHGTDRQVE